MSSFPPPPSSSQPPPVPLHPELPDGVERTPGPRTPGVDGGRSVFASVPVWVPFLAMVCGFFAAIVGSGLIAAVVASTGAEVDSGNLPPGILIGGTIIQDIALVGFAIFFAQKFARARLTPAGFGFRSTPFWPAVGWTLLAYVGFAVIALIYAAALGEPPEQDLVGELKEEDSLVVLIAFAFMVAIAAPLVEEFVFRGFLFGVLREKMGLVWAVVVGGAVFGIIHAFGSPLQTLGLLVILGVVLCLLYWKTRSLLPCITLHSLNNSIAYVVTKELPALQAVAVIVGSVAICLVVGAALIRARPRAA